VAGARPDPILLVDVGTGTQDILVFQPGEVIENAIQLVMPSPTMLMAAAVKRATEARAPLLLTGVTMGGGPVHWAVTAHLEQRLPVYATADAARTFDDDLSMVARMGVRVVEAAEADHLGGVDRLVFRDFYYEPIREALAAFGVAGRFAAVAVAVFDHGAAPPGYSDRRFRFDYLTERLNVGGGLAGFAFRADAIPARLTRLAAVAKGWQEGQPLLVMDTGPAAVLGALDDSRLRAASRLIVINAGNFHTLAFALERGEITALFEHHTGELSPAELEMYVRRLARGELTNDEIFADMGHGALMRRRPTGPPELVAATGPRRGMLRETGLDAYLAVPHGDMMMAGCFGLLRAAATHWPEFRPAIEEALGPPTSGL
jgi:uncharacterized protein (DUF1786 family)